MNLAKVQRPHTGRLPCRFCPPSMRRSHGVGRAFRRVFLTSMGWWSQSILFPHEGRVLFAKKSLSPGPKLWAMSPAGQAWDQLRLHDAVARSDAMGKSRWFRWVKPGWIGVQRPMPFRVKRSQLYCYPVLRLLDVMYIYIYVCMWVGYKRCEITHFRRVVQETNMHLIWPANLQYSFWFYRLDVWLKTDVKQSPVALFSRLRTVPRKQLANSLIVHLFHIGFAPALSQLGQIQPRLTPFVPANKTC